MKIVRRPRTLGSKWSKTNLLLRSKEVRPFVPETKILSTSHLLTMLNKHRMVYVKPIHGTSGNGVIRVERKPNGSFVYKAGQAQRTFGTYNAMYAALSKSKLKRAYLIQKGIHLLTHQKRIFDIRVMVQKNLQEKWEVTGYIGRVAHPKKIVTNFHNSGKPLALEPLIGTYLNPTKTRSFINQLQSLGLRIAKQFQSVHPGFKEIGVDIGVDKQFKPWIIEVNTAPDPFIFNQLTNKQMYRKALRLARHHGRFVR
ncbi:YheC/YheD family protein [Paenibacillus athensensis]|uniref:Endospore coat-associated protein n=1 Tax=Paenibacillus athensensis TaxID=1967502 RepID=A0A4Y8Q0E2_9BACL|nr:YheC/YheD family protein [Paenibacillus athensensis]MCD1258548.1 YheC/YheD family protein [Paenibacillus athensensis]